MSNIGYTLIEAPQDAIDFHDLKGHKLGTTTPQILLGYRFDNTRNSSVFHAMKDHLRNNALAITNQLNIPNGSTLELIAFHGRPPNGIGFFACGDVGNYTWSGFQLPLHTDNPSLLHQTAPIDDLLIRWTSTILVPTEEE